MKKRLYRCARCGRRLKIDDPRDFTYSRFTGNRYCVDLDACARRAKRAAAKEVVA